jgi:hypothetical protein
VVAEQRGNPLLPGILENPYNISDWQIRAQARRGMTRGGGQPDVILITN